MGTGYMPIVLSATVANCGLLSRLRIGSLWLPKMLKFQIVPLRHTHGGG